MPVKKLPLLILFTNKFKSICIALVHLQVKLNDKHMHVAHEFLMDIIEILVNAVHMHVKLKLSCTVCNCLCSSPGLQKL